MLAMALIAEPRLLIADEPTTALDVSTEKDILDLLVGAKKEKGLSIIFITHNLSLAAAYSDVVYVMQKGQVVEKLGSKAPAKHPYTQKLFAARLENVASKTFIGV
jgi:ABC-type dipeptide/oligopeptide/nickel transport system ATPase component